MRAALFFFVFALQLLPFMISCNNSPSCKGAEPTAIFQPDIPGVLSHSFILNESGEALETLRLQDSFSLELWQSNCNSMAQEFRFTIPLPSDTPLTPPQIAQLAAAQFHRLSLLGPAYQPFTAWAQTISAHKNDFRPGRPLEVEKNIFITIEGIPSSENLQIITSLEQKP